jgi:hypothetical protein
VWDCWIIPHTAGKYTTLFDDPALYLYAFVGNVIIFRLLWSIELYVWDFGDVNYKYLLDMQERADPQHVEIFYRFSCEMILYLLNMLFYEFARRSEGDGTVCGGLYFLVFLPPEFFPISLICTIFAVRIYEAYERIVHKKNYYSIFSPKIFYGIFTTPFSPTTFKYTFAASFLTSAARTLINGARGLCYLFSGVVSEDPVTSGYDLENFGLCTETSTLQIIASLVQLIPILIRFMQVLRNVYFECPREKYLFWPQSYNAVKYTLSLLIVLVGQTAPVNSESSATLITLSVIGLLSTTVYSWYWDVFIDWGLMQDFRWNGNFLLRKNLLYGRKSRYFYYFAIVANFVLKGLWVISLLPNPSFEIGRGIGFNEILIPFLAVLEQFRRIMWGILKVEWEHIVVAKKYSKSDQLDTVLYDLDILNPAFSDNLDLTTQASRTCSKSSELTANAINFSIKEILEGGNVKAVVVHIVLFVVFICGTISIFRLVQ